jgi:thiamine biosynthesis lipoprotein
MTDASRPRHRPAFRAAVAALAAALATGCAKREQTTLEIPTPFGAAVLRLPAGESARAAEAAAVVDQTLRRALPPLQADHRESDIARINAVAHTVTLPLASSTFRIIDLALYYSERTGGAFDITAGRLARLWGLRGGAPPEPPPAEAVSAALAGVGVRHVQIFDYGALALLAPATELDLDLLPAAYAVDQCIVNLRRRNIASAQLAFGPCVRCIGSPPDQPGWPARIADPRAPGRAMGTATLPASHALVSLDAAQGGRIDPATGWPARGTAAVFVLGPFATQAHALAEALMVAGVERSLSLTGNFPRCSFLLIPDREPAEAWATEGFLSCFAPDPAAAMPVRRLGP